jgi:hypothetical protein
LGFGLVKIFVNLINPPFGWDSLNYHFTFPVEWLKHGNLDNPITVFDDPSPSYYPVNGSLFLLWLIFPFQNVFLADLGQIPFFILAFLLVFSISRKLNFNRYDAYLAASIFTLIPNYFKQLEITYVDVMVAALFLAALNYLFLLNKEFSLKNFTVYSVTLGLLLGTKTVALPYSILLFIPLIYLYFNKRYALFLLLSLVIVAILGGLTYIRNFLDTGNPLYPLDLKLFGKDILKGVMDTGTYSARFILWDYRLSKLLFHEGLGIQTLIFILPSVFLALPLALIKNRKALNFGFTYFLILPLLLYLVYRFIIPLANARYLYSLLAMGIILGFYTAYLLNIPRIILRILVVISVLASMFELASHWELISAVILTVLLFFFALLLLGNKRQRRLKIKVLMFFALILFLVIFIFLEKNYVKNEYPRYIKMVYYSGFWPEATRAWDWLNSNTGGDNIAYAGRPVPFPLYGANFKNKVYYVSVNNVDPAKLHYFHNSYYHWDEDALNMHKNFEAQNNYRGNADYPTWLNNLYAMEDNWAKANADIFKPVFNNETIHIYKIRR